MVNNFDSSEAIRSEHMLLAMRDIILKHDPGTVTLEQRQGAVKELRAMETYKKKSRYQLCLFLFSNNNDIQNNNRNYRKPCWISWMGE